MPRTLARVASSLSIMLCLPLGSCFTALVWGDFGRGHVETRVHRADYAVDRAAVDAADDAAVPIAWHAVQTGGELLPALQATCAPDCWLLLQPDPDAEAALAMLNAPTAFDLLAADATLQHRELGALGNDWQLDLALHLRARGDAFGKVGPTRGDEAATAASAPPIELHDALRRCAADLQQADWSFVAGRALDRRIAPRLCAFVAADGTRWTPPPAPPSIDLTAPPPFAPWRAQLRALADVRAEFAVAAADGAPLTLTLQVPLAWTLACTGAHAALDGDLRHRTRCRAELAASPPATAELRAPPLPLRLTLAASEQVQVAGETFGSVCVRILATPFACAADVAGGFLVLAIASALDCDDDDDTHGANGCRKDPVTVR